MPTATAASSLLAPAAIWIQNRCLCSRVQRVARPGDRIGGLPVALAPQPASLPTSTSEVEVLRRPVESALHQDVTVVVDPAEALHAYDAAERHFAVQEHIEVVLIGSDSLDTLRRTHANYFDGTAALERLLPAG
jgi:hypothetical protein